MRRNLRRAPIFDPYRVQLRDRVLTGDYFPPLPSPNKYQHNVATRYQQESDPNLIIQTKLLVVLSASLIDYISQDGSHEYHLTHSDRCFAKIRPPS